MRYILRAIFAFAVSFCIIAPAVPLLNYGIDGVTLLTLLLLIHLVLNLLLFNTKVFKWISISVGGALLLSVIFVLLKDGAIYIPSGLATYFETLFLSITGVAYITESMYLPTLALLSAGISLLVYLLIQKLKAYYTLYIIVFGYFAFLIIGNFRLDFSYFLIFIFTSLLMYFENYFSLKLNGKKQGSGLFAVIPSLLVFALMLTSVSYLTSSLKSDPAGFVDRIVAEVRSINFGRSQSAEGTVVTYQTETAYSQGYSSFDSTIVMVVDAPRNFHLRSQTYDFYDGLNWSSSRTLEKRESSLEADARFVSLETLQNVLGYYSLKYGALPDIQDMSEDDFFSMAEALFESAELKIDYSNIRTKAIFTPANAFNISQASESLLVDLYSGTVSSENTVGKDYSYIIKTLVPKTDNAEFSELLRTAGPDSPIEKALANPNLDAYLQVPDSVPDRVQELAEAVTESFDNDYDKARALERYLSLNYKYELNVGITPQNEDFVDYFLFESKTGYCTYYASAMTIMARSLGIPARYARGYVMPKKAPVGEMIDEFGQFLGIEEILETTIYNIYERYAHAWPEIYIRGYGWMAFEPTTTYYTDFLPREVSVDYYEPAPTPDDLIPDPSGNTGAFGNLLTYFRYFLFAFLLLGALSPFALRMIRRTRYTKYDNRRKVLHSFTKITSMLRLINKGIQPYETARIYAARISAVLYPGSSMFDRAVNIFEQAKYSEQPITVFDLNIVENLCSEIRRDVLSYGNRFRLAGYYLAGVI